MRFRKIFNINFKFVFNMSDKSNRTWSIILTIVKYAITLVLGALGASNVEPVSNLLSM